MERACVLLRGALKINHDKIMGTITTHKSWKLLTMFAYLFSTLRKTLKVPAARTLFNTRNLRRKSRNKLLIKSGVMFMRIPTQTDHQFRFVAITDSELRIADSDLFRSWIPTPRSPIPVPKITSVKCLKMG